MSLESWIREDVVIEEKPKKKREFGNKGKLKLKGVFLVSADYDPNMKKVFLKFYDPSKEEIYIWHDPFGHHPYCYSKERPEELRKKPEISENERIMDIITEEKIDPITDKKIIVSKIIASDPLAIGGTRSSLRERMRLWEADIKYYINYIFDLGLQVGVPYDVDGDSIRISEVEIDERVMKLAERALKDEAMRDKYLKWLRILSSKTPRYKRVSFDLEVYVEEEVIPSPSEAKYPILAASFYGSDGLKLVLINDMGRNLSPDEFKGKEYQVKIFKDEKKMIEEIFSILTRYPFVITFNGDSFDLPYLYHRALNLGFHKEEIPIKLGRNDARIIKGIHIDLYKFFFNKSIKIYAFKNRYETISLEEISEALLGKGKVKVKKLISELSPATLAEYSFTDGKLTYELTSFNNDLVMRLITVIARISNMTIDDVCRLSVSNWIKNRIMQMHRERGVLIPLREEIKLKGERRFSEPITKGKKYIGAVVVRPKPGVFFDVYVMDFASLYPSILKQFNISYETVNCPHERCKDNLIPGTGHWCCRLKKGIMSEFVGIIRDLRVNIFKKLAKDKSIPEEDRRFYDVIQGALKVIINASYGVFGSDSFQFYYLPAAESVTLIGRRIITETINYCKKLGLEVLYGDTDSLFIRSPEEEKLRELINFVKEKFNLDLEIDKIYRYVAFSMRKKNYFGVLTNGQVDVKGLVGKKRNTPELIKNAFFRSLEVLKNVKTASEFEKAKEKVKEIYFEAEDRIRKRKFTLEEIAISTVLGKSLEEYTATTPEHVKAAKLLQATRGRVVKPGEIIRYIKTRGRLGVKPIEGESESLIREVDTRKYIELLRSTFDQLLDAIGVDLEKEKGREWNRLESFM